jgi:hypothetical protein
MSYLKKVQALMGQSSEVLESEELTLEMDPDGWFWMVEVEKGDRKVLVSLQPEDTVQLYNFLHRWLGEYQ